MHPDSAPLAGMVVIELGHSVAAPFAGQILGDLGAEVIKMEKAEGDDARHWGPPFWDGASASFQPLNRNKKSVVCDLRDHAQLDRAQAPDPSLGAPTWCCRICRPGPGGEARP